MSVMSIDSNFHQENSPWAELKWIATSNSIVIRLFKEVSFYGRGIFEPNVESFTFSGIIINGRIVHAISRKHFVIQRIKPFLATIKVISNNGLTVKSDDDINDSCFLSAGEKKILKDGDKICIDSQDFFKFQYKNSYNYCFNYPNELLKKYVIGESINNGGQGAVRVIYSTEKQTINSIIDSYKFAMKVIPVHRRYNDSTQQYQKRLIHADEEQNNMRLLKQHINIVKFMDNFSYDNHRFIVMEFCNMDLLAFMRRFHNQLIPEKISKPIFLQICYGLSFIHSKHIAHRDIKVENIFMSVYSHPNQPSINIAKIGDFGFSKQIHDDALHTQCGTECYFPPEVLINQDYDLKADIWTLGCLYFSILKGSYPFHDNYKVKNKRVGIKYQILNAIIHWGDRESNEMVSDEIFSYLVMLIKVQCI